MYALRLARSMYLSQGDGQAGTGDGANRAAGFTLSAAGGCRQNASAATSARLRASMACRPCVSSSVFLHEGPKGWAPTEMSPIASVQINADVEGGDPPPKLAIPSTAE